MKLKNIRLWAIFFLRWCIGVSFLVAGIRNVAHYPVSTALAVLFGVLLIPITEQILTKKFNLELSTWQKMLIAGLVFFLFGTSLPKPPTPPQNTEASPAVESVEILESSDSSGFVASDEANPATDSSGLSRED